MKLVFASEEDKGIGKHSRMSLLAEINMMLSCQRRLKIKFSIGG